MPKRRANPLAWLVVVGVVLLVVLGVRAIGGGSPYGPAAAELAGATSRLGRSVAGLRAEIGALDRLELFRRLRSWEREAQGHLRRARELSPPQEFRLPAGYLVASLGLRADALRRLTPAVRNALSDKDIQVAVGQLVNVMRDLVLADRTYALMRQTWPRTGPPRPPAGQWVPDPDQATIEGVTNFVRELRKQPALASVYNLTIASVAVNPKPVGKERDVDLVPFTRSLEVSVVVENTGNQRIPATTVSASLTSETDPEPQTVEAQLGALNPKDRRSVVLRGLEPTPGGPLNLLQVTVGPVGGEKNTLDNAFAYKFVMRRP